MITCGSDKYYFGIFHTVLSKPGSEKANDSSPFNFSSYEENGMSQLLNMNLQTVNARAHEDRRSVPVNIKCTKVQNGNNWKQFYTKIWNCHLVLTKPGLRKSGKDRSFIKLCQTGEII